MAKSTKGEQSKLKIIECAAELFLKNGYNATGINDILSNTGLPKGSFYFHFSSKKNLAVEVALYFENKIGQWILGMAKENTWEDFVRELTSQMISGAENSKHMGCPFAVLGLEIAFSEPDIAEYYAKSMKKLNLIFVKVLKFSGVKEKDCETLANKAFAIYEGHLVYYRISKEIEALKRMQEDLIDIYENYKNNKNIEEEK